MARTQTDLGWGPGHGPYWYTALSEPTLSTKLRRLAEATADGAGVDSVSFQPCTHIVETNQDMRVVERWAMSGGEWVFCGVFDGHSGPDTSEHARVTLPKLVRNALTAALSGDVPPAPDAVATLLADAIKQLDDELTKDVLKMFPENPEELKKLSVEAVRRRIMVGENLKKVALCMEGSTVLISLTDPGGKNLWVASLGDCRAVLGTRNAEGSWDAQIVSFHHNVDNPAEVDMLHTIHPLEDEVVVKGRVLGSLQVTRSLGDHVLKLPAVYTNQIFGVIGGRGFMKATNEFIHRMLTPPYISSTAEVRHIALPERSSPEGVERVLVLSSDGLGNLGVWPHNKEAEGQAQKLAQRWVECAVGAKGEDGKEPMRALAVLRDALGGEDTEQVSRMLTVELNERWMDDTTVVVQVV